MATAMVVDKEVKAGPLSPLSRGIFLAGAGGGLGKTRVAQFIREYLQSRTIPHIAIDMDSENKARGSFKDTFPDALKINIQRPGGLDTFINVFDDDVPVVLADMGAGSGAATFEWFNSVFEGVKKLRVALTAVCVITQDSKSVTGTLEWASALKDRVEYLVVENSHVHTEPDFSYWLNDEKGSPTREFREKCKPRIIKMESGLSALDNAMQQNRLTMSAIAEGKTAPGLNRMSAIRAQGQLERFFAQLDTVRDLLVP